MSTLNCKSLQGCNDTQSASLRPDIPPVSAFNQWSVTRWATTLLTNTVKIRFLSLSAIALALILSSANIAQANPVSFAVTGDGGYDDAGEPVLQQMFADMNADTDLRLVIHVGDLSYWACYSEILQSRLDTFNNSQAPLIYTPGDNEWADCYPKVPTYKAVDPLAQLDILRQVFFPVDNTNTATSLGVNRITLDRQSSNGDDPSTPLVDESKFTENQMWIDSNVLFVTLNIPGNPQEEHPDNCIREIVVNGIYKGQEGSYDNLPNSCSAEQKERQAANIAWLHQAFVKAKAEGVIGVVVAYQAEMSWNIASNTSDGTCPADGAILRDGSTLSHTDWAACKVYEPYRIAFREESNAFGKPVALMFGDAHLFRYFQPIKDAPNLVAVQTTGDPNVGWIKATIDANDPNVFSFEVGGAYPMPVLTKYLGFIHPAPTYLDWEGVMVKILEPNSLAGRNFLSYELGVGLSSSCRDNKADAFGIPTCNYSTNPLVTLPYLPSGGVLEGEIAYVGRGCPPDVSSGNGKEGDPYLTNPYGKIAVIDRGLCYIDNKVARAQKAGAIAVIIANTSDSPSGLTGQNPVISGPESSTVITIPAVVIPKTTGLVLKSSPGVKVRLYSPFEGLRELVEINSGQ